MVDIGWMTKSTVIQKTRWLMSMPESLMKLWNGSKRSQEERRSRKVTAITFKILNAIKANKMIFSWSFDLTDVMNKILR